MIEFLEIPFIRNAVIGGVILAVLLSVLSLFINLKNWSFITVGISHAAFGGLAIGFFMGLSPSIVGTVFAVVIGMLIAYISKHGKVHEDVSIGILFSISMALGVIFITLTPNYNTDLFTFCCFDEEVAYTSGVNTIFLYYSIILIVAVATVLSVKLVGVILASAMMILPVALTGQIFWHYRSLIAFSILISVLMVLIGIYVSYQFNLPSGATIVFIYSLLFTVVVGIKSLLKK